MEDARERYVKKYGIDPSNPKLDDVDGVLLTGAPIRFAFSLF